MLFRCRDPKKGFSAGENIRVADACVVDIMLNACGQTCETLIPYAETMHLDGIPIRTINLVGLLLTKPCGDASRTKTDAAAISRG